jgi:hypothetical protein
LSSLSTSLFAGNKTCVTFTLFPQRKLLFTSAAAMYGFDSEVSFNPFNESQTADRESIGPSIVLPRQFTPKRLADPLVCSLKL